MPDVHDDRLEPSRRGPVRIVRGIPYADAATTLSLMPGAAIGEWLAANRDAMHGFMLDVGCGNAPYRNWYLPLVERVVACDPAPLHTVDVQAVAETLPFADEVFDCVLASEVLEHVDNAEAAVSEIRRVLKPGGHLVVSVPFVYPVHEEPHDHRRFTHFGLAGLLQRHGFEVQDLRAKGGLGVLLGHWALMMVVRALVVISRWLPGRYLLTSDPLVRLLLALPQRIVIRRGVARDVSGTASWATLGYMARARKR